MSFDRSDSGSERGKPTEAGASPSRGPGKSTQVEAAQGITGSASSLPHRDAIQRSFGTHDISHIQAHTDGAAAQASAAIGAEAYATGDHVAFAGAPSLHTAAHEAAHVIQQRGGVQLKGGVGESGDAYERHADAVADRVVAGASAQDLLDLHAPAGAAPAAPTAVQRAGTKRKLGDGSDDEAANDNGASTSTVDAANKNARTAAHPLDALRDAVTAGNAGAALTAFQALTPADRAQIDEPLLLGIARLDAGVAFTILCDRRPARSARLQLVSTAAPPPAILTEFLRREGVTSAATLATAVPSLAAAPAFHQAAVLDPILATGGSAADQRLLATVGEAMLRAAYPSRGPLDLFPQFAADLATVRDAFEHTPALRAWILTQPALLLQKILAAHDGLAWARLLWTSAEAGVLAGWINADQAVWGAALGDGLLAGGTAADGAVIGGAGSATVTAVLTAIMAVKQATGLAAILAKLGLPLAQQLHALDAACLLTPTSLPLIINRAGVTAAEQDALTRDDAAVTIVRRVLPTLRADQALIALAGTPATFAAAIAPQRVFTEWVTKDRARLWDTMSAVVAWPTWLDAIRQLNGWGLVLELASDAHRRQTLKPHILPLWHWLMTAVDKPVGTQVQADTILQLYGDGAGIALADKYLTWSALYRAQLSQVGQDYVSAWTVPAVPATPGTPGQPAWNWRDTYVAVAPNDDAMNLFFHQFRQMPRALVDSTRGVSMVNVHRVSATDATNPANVWYVAPGVAPTQAVIDQPVSTSYYMNDNWIIMQSATGGGVGTPSTYRIPVAPAGDALAVNTEGIDPLSAGTKQPLTMFQNHATHEVGHAVGAKTLNRGSFHTSGDDWTQVYGAWAQNGTADGYATMCGWPAADDTKAFTIINPLNPIAPVHLQGAVIKAFLVGLVGSDRAGMAGHAVATAFAGVDAALLALAGDATLGHSLLVRNVVALAQLGSMPDMSYTITAGIAAGAPKVNFFCTRWGNQWVTYDSECWRNRVSHYSVSSYKEMFAEMYTAKFTGAGLPPAHNGHDPAVFFHELEQADPAELGLPAYANTTPATPGAPAQTQAADPAHAQGGGEGQARRADRRPATAPQNPALLPRPPAYDPPPSVRGRPL